MIFTFAGIIAVLGIILLALYFLPRVLYYATPYIERRGVSILSWRDFISSAIYYFVLSEGPAAIVFALGVIYSRLFVPEKSKDAKIKEKPDVAGIETDDDIFIEEIEDCDEE